MDGRITSGTVVWTLRDGLMVVRNNHGYTIVEMPEDDHLVRRGDEIMTDWSGGYGGADLYHQGIEYLGWQHRTHATLEDAVKYAQELAFKQ